MNSKTVELPSGLSVTIRRPTNTDRHAVFGALPRALRPHDGDEAIERPLIMRWRQSEEAAELTLCMLARLCESPKFSIEALDSMRPDDFDVLSREAWAAWNAPHEEVSPSLETTIP